MRLVGSVEQPLPLVAVLEVSGAVLTWVVDDPAGADAAQIDFTDAARADWLWQVVGASGHVALLSSAGQAQEAASLDIAPGSLARLHRLALGHWLRRWWPASQRDGIPALDRALLDAEVALLTAGAQGYFTDDTLDSDVSQLLAPHAAALAGHAYSDDSRVREMVRAGAELADEVGLEGADWAELSVAVEDSATALTMPTGFRDDYALAAGSEPGPGPGAAIGRGVASINWGAVPPRHLRRRRGHRRLERRGGRSGRRRRGTRGRHRPRPGHRCGGPGPLRRHQRRRRPGRRRPGHRPPGRRAARRADGIGGLEPRLADDVGDHRRPDDRDERTAGGPGPDSRLGAGPPGPTTARCLPGRSVGERVFLLRVAPASLC